MRNNHTTNNLSTATEVKTNSNETIVMNAFPIGHIKMAYVPVSEMKIDTDYQRVATRKVDRIANEWNNNKCDPISISYRDGIFYITDGQHRFLAALRNNVTHLPAIIRTGLTQKDEARIFVSQNDNVSKLTPYDTFKGNLLLESPVDCAINDLSIKYGLNIKNSPKDDKKTIGSLSEARSIVKNQGKDCLDWIYKIISSCGWETEAGAYGTDIIRTLRTAYVNNIDDLVRTEKYICNFFENTTPKHFRAEAVTEYITREPKSACCMYLMKKIQEAYLKENNMKTLTRTEFREHMTREKSKVSCR